MSDSETLFKRFLERKFPGSLIRKIPDFKQINSSLMRGFPDFVVFSKGDTYWFEVKHTDSVHRLNINAFTPAQLVFFKQLYNNGGVDVVIAIYNKDMDLFLCHFSDILDVIRNDEKSFVFS